MLYHEITWRGTQRRFEVIFANVRELPDESLSTHADERKVVVDFPFDEPGHTPADAPPCASQRFPPARCAGADAGLAAVLPERLGGTRSGHPRQDRPRAGRRAAARLRYASLAGRPGRPRASSCGISRASSDSA